MDHEIVESLQMSKRKAYRKLVEVMDLTAASLAMENRLPIQVFALKEPENIFRVLQGEKLGTLVTE